MKNFIKKNYFAILIILFAVIRILLTVHLTAYEIGNAGVDDTYMIFTAYALKQKCWQGVFSNSTLIKGITAPFILSYISKFNISYIGFTSFFYTVSAIAITYSLKNLIKNKVILLSIFVILLFNPVMFGTECVQRIYRNEFVPPFSLLIMSCYFYIFTKEELELTDIFLINSLAGIFLGMFFNLREESIWIFPFIIFFTITNIIKLKSKEIPVFKSVLLISIPIIILVSINNIICFINYKYYGVYRRVDFISDPFEKTYTYISKIDYPETDIKEGVSTEKLLFLFKISPSLNKYRNELLDKFEFYDNIDDNRNNKKVDNGWWQWTLRQSLSRTDAYKDLKSADEYYDGVYKELKIAEKKGKIKIRKTNYVSCFLEIIKRLKKALNYIVEIKEINSNIGQESSYASEMPIVDEWYRDIIKDRFIYSEKDIDLYHIADKQEQKEYLEKYYYVSDNLNSIINIYRFINPKIFIIAVIGYLLHTIDIFRRKINYLNLWIIESSLIGTLFVMLLGYSYVHLISFVGIFSYTYLSGTYAIMLLFETLAITYIFNKINNIKNGEKNERGK